MPPELLEGEKLSPLVDVYSFGIIMWECFTGEVGSLSRPFSSGPNLTRHASGTLLHILTVSYARPVQAPFDKMLEWKIYSAVVTDGERPRLDIFDDALKRAEMSQAECEAVQLYMALMQRCWAADPSQRPRFCEVWLCFRSWSR
jgi:serine/threonine protein kinase